MQNKTGLQRSWHRLLVKERVDAATRQRRLRTWSRAPAQGKHRGLVIAGRV